MEKVARLGCLICRKEGNPFSPAELHHIKDVATIGGQRASHFEVIPLCVNHHRIGKESFHENSKGFSEKWGSQRELLKETLAVIKTSQGICQGAPIPLADDTGAPGGVNAKITQIEQKIDQILSTKYFIEPNVE